MATGDHVQAAGFQSSASNTITLSAANSQPSAWATPTSGNTLVLIITSASSITSGTTGWTQQFQHVGQDVTTTVFDKTSAGTESTITIGFGASNDNQITCYEIEGDVTYDDADGNDVLSGTTATAPPSGTITLTGASSYVIGYCFHWTADDTTITTGYTLDGDYGSGSNGELYRQGWGHKTSTASGETATGTIATGGDVVQTLVIGYNTDSTPPVTGDYSKIIDFGLRQVIRRRE